MKVPGPFIRGFCKWELIHESESAGIFLERDQREVR